MLTIILPETFFTVQKSKERRRTTVTKTPINEPEKAVPNKYMTKAEILKKKWKNATQGRRKVLF